MSKADKTSAKTVYKHLVWYGQWRGKIEQWNERNNGNHKNTSHTRYDNETGTETGKGYFNNYENHDIGIN